MIQYTCDFCGCPILPDEPRFEVRIEVHLSGDEEDDGWGACDFDLDFCECLEFDEGDGPLEPGEEILHSLRFDLCPACQAAFLTTPPAPTRHLSLEYNN